MLKSSRSDSFSAICCLLCWFSGSDSFHQRKIFYFFYLFVVRSGYLQCRPVHYLCMNRTNEATFSEIFFMRFL